MAREIINVGATPNDGQGDPIRTAFIKTNNNFGELYSRLQVVPPVALTGSVGDTAGMTAYDEEYYYYCFANYDGSSIIWRQVPNAAQANVTAVSATGNITASYFFGDGGQLSNVVAGPGTELINGTTNITVAYDGNANVTVGGTSNVAVFTASGVDIAGNVTAATLSTTGNVDAGNLVTTGAVSATGVVYSTAGFQTAAALSAAGNVTGGNILTSGAVSATGTATVGNIATSGTASIVGNVNTSANIIAVGNVVSNYFIGDGGFLSNVTVASNVAVTQIANGTTVMAVTGSAGNIAVTVNGIPNVVQIVPIGIEVAGNVNTANVYNTGKYVGVGNVTGANLIATSNVIATGNVHGTYINADLTMSATGNITTAAFFKGDGRYISNITTAYGDPNVAVFLSNFGSNTISTTGNITVGNMVAAGGHIQTVDLVVNKIYADDSTSIIINDGLEVNGEIKGYKLTAPEADITSVTANSIVANGIVSNDSVTAVNLVVNYISSDDSTAVVVEDGLSVHGDLDVIGDISGHNLVINSISSDDSTAVVIEDRLSVHGDADVIGDMSATGNITGNYFIGNGSQLTGVTATGVGTLSLLSVTGNTTTGNLLTGGTVSATGNVIGTYFVGTATQAHYADIAENYTADANYEPGTVLEFGGDKEVTIAADETARVAGIVSTSPAHLMNSMLSSEYIVPVALLGRVPCKVRGNVAKGDMLVAAGGGYARSKQNPMIGTVIGKALEASTGDHGIIEVVVGRL